MVIVHKKNSLTPWFGEESVSVCGRRARLAAALSVGSRRARRSTPGPITLLKSVVADGSPLFRTYLLPVSRFSPHAR